MGKYILSTAMLLIGLSCFAQDSAFQKIDFRNIKRDTIETNFLIEVNNNVKFYTTEHIVFQQNLLFVASDEYLKNPRLLYKSDSLFLYRWNELVPYIKFKSYYKFKSIEDFHLKAVEYKIQKYSKKKFEKNIVKNIDGVEFMKFHAKVVVINLGSHEWNIPWLYCDEGSIYTIGNFKLCKRQFANTFVFVEVISYCYYSDFVKNDKIVF